MAQYYSLEEAARALSMSTDEFRRRLATEWKTSPRRYPDGATLRFQVREIDELARTLGQDSDPGLKLADGPKSGPRLGGKPDSETSSRSSAVMTSSCRRYVTSVACEACALRSASATRACHVASVTRRSATSARVCSSPAVATAATSAAAAASHGAHAPRAFGGATGGTVD